MVAAGQALERATSKEARTSLTKHPWSKDHLKRRAEDERKELRAETRKAPRAENREPP